MKANRQREMAAGWITFLLIAVLGLLYVKWTPYWFKAFVAASNHSIGTSILMGSAASPPAPSWKGAADYARAYGKAIWQAMVLGLLLGSAVQVLLPSPWILRWLGRTNAGSVLRGAVLAVPGMMCTCCAAPVVIGLRKANASAGAAIAFWLGNSVLNPATLVFIGFVLGWRWSALRLLLGIVAVLGLGLLANRMSTPEEAGAAERQLAEIREAPAGANLFTRWLAILARLACWYQASDRPNTWGHGADAPEFRHSDQRGAAIDDDHLAGAVAFPHQIQIGVGDILALADATDRKALRNVSIQGVTIGFAHVVPQFRPDHAGTDRVHSNWRKLQGQGAGECFHRAADACDQRPSFARAQRGNASGQGDRSTGPDMGVSVLHGHERAPEADVDEAASVIKLHRVEGLQL
jgi:uncharacterized membrane protein YraQ (UPF0718 family)